MTLPVLKAMPANPNGTLSVHVRRIAAKHLHEHLAGFRGTATKLSKNHTLIQVVLDSSEETTSIVLLAITPNTHHIATVLIAGYHED